MEYDGGLRVRCFILGADVAEIAQLERVTTKLGFAPEVRLDLGALRTDQALYGTDRVLILIAGAERASEAAAWASDLAENAFLAVVADSILPEDYKRLVRSGAGDWVQWASCETELADLARRIVAQPADDRAARVVSFLPSKGGVGNTALLAEVGVYLAGRRAHVRRTMRIATLDLNFQGGTLADLLDVEARFDLAEIVGRPERLDEQLVGAFTSRYADRLDVFAPPARVQKSDEITPNLIFTFIDAISSRYDLLLLDLPQVALSWTDTLLQGSDAIVAIGSGTVPGLRRLSARLAHLDSLAVPLARRIAVVNQLSTDLMGRFARRAEIERALGNQSCLFIRRDNAALEEAADSGRPLFETAPDCRVGRDIRRLADWVETVTARAGQSLTETRGSDA